MRLAAVLTAFAFLAGLVLVLAGTTLVLDVIGVALLALAGVALAELAFFAVGRSEDRDRAESAQQRQRRRG